MKKFGINFTNLIVGILLILLGIFFCVGNTELLTKIIFITIGLIMIITNIYPLVESINNKDNMSIIYHVIEIVFGILFIFVHNTAICILVGILLIFIPVLSIVLSKNKNETALYWLPSIVLGVLILILGPSTIGHVLYVILGVLSIIFGIISVLSSFYKQEIIK